MKKIINGRKYNTETAKAIATTGYEGSCRDFQWWEETLYQKKTGEYFLAGEGGPASKYCVSTGMNEWTGGSRITPLTEAEAKRWAEEALDVDTYEAVFGEVEE